MMVGADVQVGPAGLTGVWLSGARRAHDEDSGVVILAGADAAGSGFLATGLGAAFHDRGLATLRVNLLGTPDNAADGTRRRSTFDIGLLAARLADVMAWVRARPGQARVPVGLLATGTAAAAALQVAGAQPERVCAVVSLGGRPDLADDSLPLVQAPTLLVVGSRDATGLGCNRSALGRLRCPRRLALVPGATRLFDQPGQGDQLARLCGDWFTTHGPPSGTAREAAAQVAA